MALPQRLVTVSSNNLKVFNPTAQRSIQFPRKQAPQRRAPGPIRASGNEPTITSFNISPPGDHNALWSDDDVLEVPSLRDQLYPRSVFLKIFSSFDYRYLSFFLTKRLYYTFMHTIFLYT